MYSKLVDANPNMMVYKKESIPAHFHYQHNSRIMPILLEAKEGWTIMQNRSGTFMCKYIIHMFGYLKKKQKTGFSFLLIVSLEILVQLYFTKKHSLFSLISFSLVSELLEIVNGCQRVTEAANNRSVDII